MAHGMLIHALSSQTPFRFGNNFKKEPKDLIMIALTMFMA
jgi:hypothetical protein